MGQRILWESKGQRGWGGAWGFNARKRLHCEACRVAPSTAHLLMLTTTLKRTDRDTLKQTEKQHETASITYSRVHKSPKPNLPRSGLVKAPISRTTPRSASDMPARVLFSTAGSPGSSGKPFWWQLSCITALFCPNLPRNPTNPQRLIITLNPKP